MKTQMIIGGILFGVAACTARQTVTGLPATLKGLVTESHIVTVGRFRGTDDGRYGEYAEWKIRVRRAFGIPGFRHCKGVS